MPSCRVSLTTAVLSVVVSAPYILAARFIPLGALHESDAQNTPVDMSADGRIVVGNSFPLAGSQTGGEPFIWTEETGMVGLGKMYDDGFTLASAVSRDGSVVVGTGGYSRQYGSLTTEMFRWTEGSGLVGLGRLADQGLIFNTGGEDVSGDGSVIVGTACAFGLCKSIRWTASDGYASLGYPADGRDSNNANSISADGLVVAGVITQPGSPSEAYRWTANTGMVGIGGQSIGSDGDIWLRQVYDISADGSVIVGYGNIDGLSHAIQWTADGGPEYLDPAGVPLDSVALGVSSDGSVVVGSSNVAACRWTEQNGKELIADLLTKAGVDFSGWWLTVAFKTSDDGNIIIGGGYDPHFRARGWIVDLSETVPEPSTISTASIGLLIYVAGCTRARHAKVLPWVKCA